MDVKFIAEVSSNHNRDLHRCKEFIEKASDIGCQGVKFQLFKIAKLFAPEILSKSPEHRRRRDWELPAEFVPVLSEYAHRYGLQFSCTPFYLEAVKELEPYVDFYKIASYELLWKDLFVECANTSKPLIFSTGMATINEIKTALCCMKDLKSKDITLLKCTSAYPTPYNEANLSAINTLKRELIEFSQVFNLKFGYSDHTVSPHVITRAIHHYGCNVIEFHLDLDGRGEEFKSGHCWLPTKMKDLIDNIRMDFETDGNGIIGPTKSEMKDREWRADPEDGLRPLKNVREKYIS